MKNNNEKFIEDITASVRQDFLDRQQQRKSFESQWRLNNNFLLGNQYVGIDNFDDLQEVQKAFYWQERKVFNHIAPIIENRIAKLTSIKPIMDILPSSSNIDDQKIASLSQDILRSTYDKLNLGQTISKAIVWSEITGTSFYKVCWNNTSGKKVFDKDGKQMFEGEIEIDALSPFEIYPDNNYVEDINKCESIIHAKAYTIKSIKNIWGVDVKGENVDIVEGISKGIGHKTNVSQAIVIERYEMPSVEYPEGRLIVVCQDKLLYIGELPYINLSDGKRGFPFIKQVCLRVAGCFWGKSVIDKLIPIQRAYNAVKNRKLEYINRLSMGVLTVEDGSVDIDDLMQDGLQPGKIIVYKQGSMAPKYLSEEGLPNDFEKEEEKLLSEFSEVSGVFNILSNQLSTTSMSGVALELLLEQDRDRLNSSIEEIDKAVKDVAKMILRLYKQFAVMPRLLRIANKTDKQDFVYFKNTDLGVEDIVFTTDSSLSENISTKRDNILKLLSSDVFKNQDGKLDEKTKLKILEIFGINLFAETKQE